MVSADSYGGTRIIIANYEGTSTSKMDTTRTCSFPRDSRSLISSISSKKEERPSISMRTSSQASWQVTGPWKESVKWQYPLSTDFPSFVVKPLPTTSLIRTPLVERLLSSQMHALS